MSIAVAQLGQDSCRNTSTVPAKDRLCPSIASTHLSWWMLWVDAWKVISPVSGSTSATAPRVSITEPGWQEIGARVIGLGRGDVASDDALDGWIRAQLSPFGPGHATSSCRMGPDDDVLAVVAQDGRVRGVDGLRVADTSIFPTVTSRGTSASAVMAGERIAELFDSPGR